MTDTMSPLWQIIEEWLTSNRHSQADLAEMSGVSPATITNIKKGKSQPDANTLTKLADAMNHPRQQLLQAAGIIDTHLPDEDAQRVFTHLWSQLDDRDRAILEDMMRLMLERTYN